MHIDTEKLEKLITEINSTSANVSKTAEEEKEYVEDNLHRALIFEDLKLRKEAYELAVQNRTERKKYAKNIFTVTCIWATIIFIIVVANGLKCINDKEYFVFTISDKVMITLITSTTVNFFGFFLLVVKYLFHISPIEKAKVLTPIKRKSKVTG
jgi:hypothetical protein